MKYRYRNLILVGLLLLITINAIPSVLGKTRHSYLASFVKSNRIHNQGYANSYNALDIVSLEATANAVDILEFYRMNTLEIETLQNNLENRIEDMIENNEVELYNLFFLMKSLNILQYDIDLNLKNQIYQYLNDTEQIGGGFSYVNSTGPASLASTYYVIQLYSLINEPIVNSLVQRDWILSCNNTDGGYGGNQSLISSLANTYFAVSLLEEFWDINDLVDKNLTLTYFKSFYVDDSANLDSFGGYLTDGTAKYALLTSTYYCVKSISLINPDLNELNKNPTMKWVLARQNFEDGGFAENSEDPEEKTSSIISSFYAFETLKIFDPSLSSLSSEIWMVEFNYLILTLVLMSIGIIIALIVFIWRKRRI